MAKLGWEAVTSVLRRRETWAAAAVIVCGTAIWQFSSRGEVAVNENSIESMRFADLREAVRQRPVHSADSPAVGVVEPAVERSAAVQAVGTALETNVSNQNQGGVLRAAFEAVQPEGPPAWLTGVIEEE